MPKHSENVLERLARVRFITLLYHWDLFIYFALLPSFIYNLLTHYTLQGANNRLLSLEAYVKTHIFTTVFAVITFVVLLFYVLRYVAVAVAIFSNSFQIIFY